jgi:predicted nucleic acid-binding protein
MSELCIDASIVVKLVLAGESYAALAELLNCEFWTADKVFYDTVNARLAFVKYLPDYP